MMSFRGQANWAEMTSLIGKLTAQECHPTKIVNKSEDLTYLPTNIGLPLGDINFAQLACPPNGIIFCSNLE
jgi:hypothetical protein